MPPLFIPLFVLILISSHLSAQPITFPKVELGDIKINDKIFSKGINQSQKNELTFCSFNVRNLGAMNRSLKDYETIVDLVDEADVILLQEVGLGVYQSRNVSNKEIKRIQLVAMALHLTFGNEWGIILPPRPTPEHTRNGRETAILLYRKECKGFTNEVKWNGYVDLGDKRDMPTFKLTCKNSSTNKSKVYLLGSVHLTPYDPDRGTQMIKAVNWLEGMPNKNAIVMGDFNWGYRRKARVLNYRGEDHVRTLHDQGKVFDLFYHLSYRKKGRGKDLRTNLKFRAAGKFYDKFLTTPPVATSLADNGALLKDCGILVFEEMAVIERKLVKKKLTKYDKSMKKFLKWIQKKIEKPEEELYQKAMKKVESGIRNTATFIVSDHRPIWMQIKVW